MFAPLSVECACAEEAGHETEADHTQAQRQRQRSHASHAAQEAGAREWWAVVRERARASEGTVRVRVCDSAAECSRIVVVFVVEVGLERAGKRTELGQTARLQAACVVVVALVVAFVVVFARDRPATER